MSRAIALLAVLTAAPTLAHADGIVALADGIRLLELLIPDARYERSFTVDENRFVLSAPFVERAGRVEVSSNVGLLFNHVLEVQYEVTRSEFRGVLGERMLLRLGGADHQSDLMPFLEAGALLGSDGSGGMLGGGLALGDEGGSPWVSSCASS